MSSSSSSSSAGSPAPTPQCPFRNSTALDTKPSNVMSLSQRIEGFVENAIPLTGLPGSSDSRDGFPPTPTISPRRLSSSAGYSYGDFSEDSNSSGSSTITLASPGVSPCSPLEPISPVSGSSRKRSADSESSQEGTSTQPTDGPARGSTTTPGDSNLPPKKRWRNWQPM
ncbi:hypothetical protein C834K_0729 [Chlamydia poikilotherma]|uniref:Uncharacterized protein n=1 Tax=Chlamydia poikilotherma TaxID=1967783 RepID=A0A3B0PPQ8_9CHLA|nr:hypothetical protein [Chlamydia poikilotherma]SYX09173.1 hypothetical protein C834K_0729 [Chlamydia poikilotherma]